MPGLYDDHRKNDPFGPAGASLSTAKEIVEGGESNPTPAESVVGFYAHDGAFISGDTQFTVNNSALVKLREKISSTDLLKAGSPTGKTGAGAFGDAGGPDYTHKAFRHNAADYFLTNADLMSVMELEKFSFVGRFALEAGGGSDWIFLGMKHSVIENGVHISIDATTKILTVNAPGTTPATPAFAGALSLNFAYTIMVRFDGTTLFTEIVDEDGNSIEEKETPHAGTATDGDDFHLFKAAQNSPMRFKRCTYWNGFLTDADKDLVIANSLTEDLPGA